MQKFTIKVVKTMTSEFSMTMEPCKEVKEVADKLSIAYPNCRVEVTMFGTAIRWTFLNGVCTKENNDITTIFDNATKQDIWDWSCYGVFPARSNTIIKTKHSVNYNYNGIGGMLSFTNKMHKHINAGNQNRVKDYLCKAFDTVDPTNIKVHPAFEAIREGVKFLRANGWRVFTMEWKSIGKQLIVADYTIEEDIKWYHSNYNHYYSEIM